MPSRSRWLSNVWNYGNWSMTLPFSHLPLISTLGSLPIEGFTFTQVNLHTTLFFLGSIEFTPWKRIWKSWAPLQCKFLWLAMKNRCWTAYHLSRHRQTHPSVCSLCDQEEESIQHILVSCVFSREIWTKILLFVRLPVITPQPDVFFFSFVVSKVPKETRKRLTL